MKFGLQAHFNTELMFDRFGFFVQTLKNRDKDVGSQN